jgi:polyphosphate kinase 2 (PPK2 family)
MQRERSATPPPLPLAPSKLRHRRTPRQDSTIRKVLLGVDPNHLAVHSFRQPSDAEKDHDFLWRSQVCQPLRGKIGVFNRSYYEDVIVLRVHPEYLSSSRILPHHRSVLSQPPLSAHPMWEERLQSINNHELHLGAARAVSPPSPPPKLRCH